MMFSYFKCQILFEEVEYIMNCTRESIKIYIALLKNKINTLWKDLLNNNGVRSTGKEVYNREFSVNFLIFYNGSYIIENTNKKYYCLTQN